jgi:3-isopropylmalate dehydrogenase
MNYSIALIPGDGIGPDITAEAVRVLERVGELYGHTFTFETLLAGGAAIDSEGVPLPEHTLNVCRQSDAVLLGAVGGPVWDTLPGNKRPEMALMGLRSGLGLFANLRPAILFKELSAACPLRPDIIGDGLDIQVVRELTGGIYFGERGTEELPSGTRAYDTMAYSDYEVERIARLSFAIAMKRRKKLVSVDKANILDSSRLWRAVVEKVAADFPEVELSHMYVDNAAMQLVRNPRQFDVIVTSNMFGDILSDEASMITGSIGMLPSASLGEGSFGMYEPIHGSAPDIAGKDMANPIATILSAAMMLRHSFALEQEAAAVEEAVAAVLGGVHRTGDIMSEGMVLTGTREMGRLIREALR